MSIDLYSWSPSLDAQLLRQHVQAEQEIYNYLYLYCDGNMAQWNIMSDAQKIDFGTSVWRLIIKVCCKIKFGKHRYQLYVLTRFLHQLIPDSSKFILTTGEAVESPHDAYIKITYILRYTFVVLGGFDVLVRFVGFEALHEYCFEDPVDSCELGDFIDLLASYSKHATLAVIVSVYIQVPVSDNVIEYINKSLCIKGPTAGKLPHALQHYNSRSNAVIYNSGTTSGVFEMCDANFFKTTLMQFNTILYENCMHTSTMNADQLLQNFNSLQLLNELGWLVKEHWRELNGYMDNVFKKIVIKNLWYVRLLLEPFLTINNQNKIVFKRDVNMDVFINVLSQIKAPIFCSYGKLNCGNVYMVPVANYLRTHTIA
ncbi:hypothetical protein [Mocis latipes granulovirus]|uniref:Uncharacterized protein n=1 Tax=Mocis latipes granulovirus TaxID=2072024 RepID=A0A162GVY2_9BBAC|nr:hypothetical protein [Mocis latipes granulovirus]AKR17449.1 hypothetical protein [Mocis latipes granulovirus]